MLRLASGESSKNKGDRLEKIKAMKAIKANRAAKIKASSKPKKIVRTFKRFELSTGSNVWGKIAELQYLLGLAGDSEAFRYCVTKLGLAIQAGGKAPMKRLARLAESIPFNASNGGQVKAVQVERRGDLDAQLERIKATLKIEHDYRAFAAAVVFTHQSYFSAGKEAEAVMVDKEATEGIGANG